MKALAKVHNFRSIIGNIFIFNVFGHLLLVLELHSTLMSLEESLLDATCDLESMEYTQKLTYKINLFCERFYICIRNRSNSLANFYNIYAN